MTPFRRLLFVAYLATGGLLAGAYTLAERSGWEPAAVTRASITPTVRAPPGGSSGFWHSGSHGGK
jgi:hypothetical protein